MAEGDNQLGRALAVRFRKAQERYIREMAEVHGLTLQQTIRAIVEGHKVARDHALEIMTEPLDEEPEDFPQADETVQL